MRVNGEVARGQIRCLPEAAADDAARCPVGCNIIDTTSTVSNTPVETGAGTIGPSVLLLVQVVLLSMEEILHHFG